MTNYQCCYSDNFLRYPDGIRVNCVIIRIYICLSFRFVISNKYLYLWVHTVFYKVIVDINFIFKFILPKRSFRSHYFIYCLFHYLTVTFPIIAMRWLFTVVITSLFYWDFNPLIEFVCDIVISEFVEIERKDGWTKVSCTHLFISFFPHYIQKHRLTFPWKHNYLSFTEVCITSCYIFAIQLPSIRRF